MTVFEALQKMREMSKRGETFSFSFASYSFDRNSSDGNIYVSRGRLRKRSSVKQNKHAQCQQEYLNLDTNEPRRFWQCNLLTFNGEYLTIK